MSVILIKTLANFFQSKFTDDIARVLQYNKSDLMPYPRKKACGAIQLIFLKVGNYVYIRNLGTTKFIYLLVIFHGFQQFKKHPLQI